MKELLRVSDWLANLQTGFHFYQFFRHIIKMMKMTGQNKIGLLSSSYGCSSWGRVGADGHFITDTCSQ